jgi:hypothetical protein
MLENGIVTADGTNPKQSHFAKSRPLLQERKSIQKQLKFSMIAVY